MGVQVSAAHKAGLRRMSVNPTEDHQLFLVAVIEQLFFVQRLASVARASLFGNDEPCDEERIGF